MLEWRVVQGKKDKGGNGAMSITPIETSYKGYRFRSRTEARWAVCLDVLGVPYEYEAEGLDIDGEWYLPDFSIRNGHSFVEIKGPPPTPEEKEKCHRLHKATNKTVTILSGQPSETGRAVVFCDEDYARIMTHLRFFAPFPEIEPYVREAFRAARSARFEHGEQPYIDQSIAKSIQRERKAKIGKLDEEWRGKQEEKFKGELKCWRTCNLCGRPKFEIQGMEKRGQSCLECLQLLQIVMAKPTNPPPPPQPKPSFERRF
jgi:hypothetical protein